MRLSLQPNERPLYGHQVKSYCVALPNNDKAVVEERPTGTWRLFIYRQGGVSDRGEFGSTHDVLTLLESEYFPERALRGFP